MKFLKFKHSHKTTTSDTIFIAFFTFLPTISTILYIVVRSEDLSFEKYYKPTEFLLYAISFFSSSYIVYEQLSFNKKDWKSELNRFILICLILVAVCVAISSATPKPNTTFLNWTSFFFILISLVTFYHSQYLNNEKSVDVGAIRRDEQENIISELRTSEQDDYVHPLLRGGADEIANALE
jgi:amino acid transporter